MLQIVFKNKISGLILGFSLILVNMFMLFALISEFKEFSAFDQSALQLLFGGLFIWALNMLLAVVMIFKYAKMDIEGTTPVKLRSI